MSHHFCDISVRRGDRKRTILDTQATQRLASQRLPAKALVQWQRRRYLRRCHCTRDQRMENDKGGDGGSFEERLAAARRKQGLAAPPPRSVTSGAGGSMSSMGVGLRVGVEMLSALVVGLA